MLRAGGGLGLMKRYGIFEVRDDLHNVLSKTANKENTEALSRAMYYLDSVNDKAKYAIDISNIALYLTLRGALGKPALWKRVQRNMKALKNVHTDAILGVIKELENAGNAALEA
jgi:hypothetical protein